MKSVSINTTYDEATRILQTNVSMVGFVPDLPGQVVTATQIDTTDLFVSDVMLPMDGQAVTVSRAKALMACNKQLMEWKAAAENKAKADLLPDAPVVV